MADARSCQDMIDQLEVLIVQDVTTYKTKDYFSRNTTTITAGDDQQQNGGLSPTNEDDDNINGNDVDADGWQIDARARRDIGQWYYRVVDYFQFRREVVAVAMNYMDRFLAVRPVRNKRVFQLLGVTCLYLSIKMVVTPATLSVKQVCALSRNAIPAQHLEKMELIVIDSLQWYLHPPTPQAFLHNFMNILHTNRNSNNGRRRIFMTEDDFQIIYWLASFLLECACLDACFVDRPTFNLVIAALANAISDLYTQFNNVNRIITSISSSGTSHTDPIEMLLRQHHHSICNKNDKNSHPQPFSMCPFCLYVRRQVSDSRRHLYKMLENNAEYQKQMKLCYSNLKRKLEARDDENQEDSRKCKRMTSPTSILKADEDTVVTRASTTTGIVSDAGISSLQISQPSLANERRTTRIATK